MSIKFLREDIFFCPRCYNFHSILTGKNVDVPYSEMPAAFALEVLTARMGVLTKHPKKKRQNRK